MDGGRILRAALTPRLGRLRATLVASRLGRILAVLFGIYSFFATPFPVKVLHIAIAFLVFIAAGREYETVRQQEGAGEEDAAEAWDADKVTIGPPPYGKGSVTRTTLRPAPDRRARDRSLTL
jgi:hypothetical protein